MFFAPCILPLVPAFLEFVGGVSLGESHKSITRTDRLRIVIHTVFYILGFSISPRKKCSFLV